MVQLANEYVDPENLIASPTENPWLPCVIVFVTPAEEPDPEDMPVRLLPSPYKLSKCPSPKANTSVPIE